MTQTAVEVGGQPPDAVRFFAQEGSFLYALPSELAGWGSVEQSSGRARVLMVRNKGTASLGVVMAEAEIRVSTARPDYNALQLTNAATALQRQIAWARQKSDSSPLALAERLPRRTLRSRALRIVRRASEAFESYLRPKRLQWTIGILEGWDIAAGGDVPWERIKWLKPPADGFIADPFLVKEGERLWLFYEQLAFAENLGTLCVAPFDPVSCSIGPSTEILRSKYHLSFPNVFSDGNHWYMLPEEAKSGTTSLYRAFDFPYRWERARELLPGFPGIDPVLHFHDGRWWLFATHGMHPCNENNLHLFSAPALDAEFVAHPMSPVATGLHGSRMAGRLVQRGDELFRFGQDGREGYGRGMVLFKITCLTETHYSEAHVRTWTPSPREPWGDGFHTYTECRGVTVVDGQRVIPGKRKSLGEILSRLASAFRKGHA